MLRLVAQRLLEHQKRLEESQCFVVQVLHWVVEAQWVARVEVARWVVQVEVAQVGVEVVRVEVAQVGVVQVEVAQVEVLLPWVLRL